VRACGLYTYKVVVIRLCSIIKRIQQEEEEEEEKMSPGCPTRDKSSSSSSSSSLFYLENIPRKTWNFSSLRLLLL